MLGRVLHHLSTPSARLLARPSPRVSHQEGRDRQLLVDVSATLRQDVRTGIQRVVRAWLAELHAHPPDGFQIRPVFATFQQSYRYAPSSLTAGQLEYQLAEAVRVEPGDVFLGIDLSAHLLPRWQWQLLKWKRSGVRLDVVVHDLLPLQHPEWFNPKTVRHFRRWALVLAKYVDTLICTTHAVAQDVQTWKDSLGLASHALPNVQVVPLGADIDASLPSHGMSADHVVELERLENREIVLMVGTVEPRKGHAIALDAMDYLWRQTGRDTALVMVGRPGWKTDALQHRLLTHAAYRDRLFWFNDASDDLLQRLYGVANGVFIPSFGEGYGLPLVEAMYFGLPLLARDLAVFHEIAGNQIDYFHDDSPSALATRLTTWLDAISSAPRRKYAVRTWQQSSALLRQLYEAPAGEGSQ